LSLPLLLAASCASHRWVAAPGIPLEGAWTSTTAMSKYESGSCTLQIRPDEAELLCGPGRRHITFGWTIVETDGARIVARAIPPDGAPIRLQVDTLSTADGVRALRLTDLDHPEHSPLGAYGHPDLWIAGR
jgi:hypothetical protein